jgi:hypothetical protein
MGTAQANDRIISGRFMNSFLGSQFLILMRVRIMENLHSHCKLSEWSLIDLVHFLITYSGWSNSRLSRA